jgi:cyclin B
MPSRALTTFAASFLWAQGDEGANDTEEAADRREAESAARRRDGEVPVEHEAALEYGEDMLRQMLRRELHYMPGSDYQQWQVDGDGQMRAMLNEWLLEVIRAHGFKHETLFLTVSLVDRYLSLTRVGASKLLLVGVTAMLIAAKFEEVKPPEVKDLAQYTAGACSKREIVEMERSMLVTLSFEITCPTVAHFFLQFRALEKKASRPADLARFESRQDEDAWRMLELALLHEQMLRHPPSRLAAAALMMANRLCGRPGPHWPLVLSRLCQRSEGALEACARELRELLEEEDRRPAPAQSSSGGGPSSASSAGARTKGLAPLKPTSVGRLGGA